MGSFDSKRRSVLHRSSTSWRALYNTIMTKRSKMPIDPNQLAHRIVQIATGQLPKPGEKNPAAQLLGHLGGLKGGPARAAALSKKRRSDIGKLAAKARWGK